MGVPFAGTPPRGEISPFCAPKFGSGEVFVGSPIVGTSLHSRTKMLGSEGCDIFITLFLETERAGGRGGPMA